MSWLGDRRLQLETSWRQPATGCLIGSVTAGAPVLQTPVGELAVYARGSRMASGRGWAGPRRGACVSVHVALSFGEIIHCRRVLLPSARHPLLPSPVFFAAVHHSIIMADPTKAETDQVFKVLKSQKGNKVCLTCV